MHNAFSAILGLIAPVCLAATISNATAAPPAKAAEDRYVAARDAAIEKISAIYDAGNADDAARRAEEAASADLAAQMRAILNEAAREGFGPAKLHIDTFYKGDEGFGMLDGLRFDALLGKNGEKAGQDGADGKYVEPKAHIIVTTQTLFERWLRAHKDWWGKDIKNLPQQIGAALKDESFYTQAVSSGSAVVNFNSLPIAKPADASFANAMLAGRTNPISPTPPTMCSCPRSPMARFTSPMARSIPWCKFPPASPSGPATTKRPNRPKTTSGSRRSTGRLTTNWEICARRARTNTSAASRRMRQSRPPLRKQPGRRRNCCRR